MTRVQKVVGAVSLVAVLLALWLLRMSPGAVAARESAAKRAEVLEPVATGPRPGAGLEIEARAVRRAPVSRLAEVAAVLEAVRHVTLAAEVEGRVVEIVAEEHAPIDADAPLVRLESGFLEAAALRQEGALQRARANHELARIELRRQRGLAQVTSKAELDRAINTERARLADVREAEATLADARLRLRRPGTEQP